VKEISSRARRKSQAKYFEEKGGNDSDEDSCREAASRIKQREEEEVAGGVEVAQTRPRNGIDKMEKVCY